MTPHRRGAIAFRILNPERALEPVVVHGVFADPFANLRVGAGARGYSQQNDQNHRRGLRHNASLIGDD